MAACLSAGNALALGLGRLSVQSALGESLRAEIDITSMSPEEAASLRVRIASPEAFRAAGIDYNTVLPGTQAVMLRRSDGRPYLRLTSNRPVQEPFVDVILELTWPAGRLVREYTMLFDPPTMARAPEAVPTAPATPARITAAPVPPVTAQSPAAPAPRVVERRPAPAPAPAPAPTQAQAPAPAPAPSGSADAAPRPATGSADEYRVRPGDNLSRIASRTQRPGVSLDQMLVALFRGNPAAFIDSNMNRLRAGAVLAVPSAQTANAASPGEARQVIQAQSADFGAYRQRLAGIVPAARTDTPARQASGKVEAQVDDRRAGAATPPDKLTLSRGGTAAPGSAEDRISKGREKAAADSRLAELNRNVDSLTRAASAPVAGTATAGAGTAAPSTAAPTLVAAAPVAPPPTATPTLSPAPLPAAASAVAATTAAVAPAASAATPAPVRAASAPVVAAASAARATPTAPVTSNSTGVMAWMEENPLLLAAGAAIVALLAGLGIYRVTQRSRRDSGETSFLESRLQPDSFFGASGGQRIDTRDAGTASSSMSYSLSQLDAIGDVDPVAEADVYLAYGRDLQAEEILKEAMRSTPDRAAIRTKLLEVYAKRRDTKGFELLAAQLYALTRGQGDDWAKAQEMGALIDPDNAMYRDGGVPANLPPSHDRAGEALGATTMPQSVMPASSAFRSGFDATTQAPPASDLDLDLGHAASNAHAATQPLPTAARHDPDAPMDFDLDAPDLSLPDLPSAPMSTPAPAPAAPMPFDLSSISLDLDLPPEVASPALPAATALKPGPTSGFDLDLDDASDSGDSDDPISRKLDLADEFRQIGDTDGARDLLQEVVAKSTGSVRARAQGMLDELG
ncbi:MAG: FimV/HubP family polar landmark protein [Burkholderiaceae bacterium]